MTTTAILYIRKSGSKQEHSFGAQEAKLRRFCDESGWMVLEVIKEEASGAKDDRTGLERAVSRAQATQSKLVVLRVDRLGRKLSTIARLLEEKNLQICVAEMGKCLDPFVVSIMACVAQQERELISKRTKEALALLKAQGVQLGGPREHLKQGPSARRAKADQKILDNWNHYQMIWNLHQTGSTYKQIAEMMGLKNSKGNLMAPMAVKRLVERFDRLRKA